MTGDVANSGIITANATQSASEVAKPQPKR